MSLIVWRGPSLLDGAPVRLSLVEFSRNRKTGNMVQAYILRDDMSPLEAFTSGADRSICGDCPLSGLQPDGSRKGRACYVRLDTAPQSTWWGGQDSSLAQGIEMVRGRELRAGAYGEPAAVPLEVWLELVMVARKWTGYTHQWRNLPAWRDVFMASADSPAQRRAAKAIGWRTFRASPDGEAEPGEITCPNITHGVQCRDCGLCDGTRFGTRSNVTDIVIAAHGAGRKNIASETH